MGEKGLVRSGYGGARPRQDVPLEQINDGFAGMAKGAVVRAVLTLS